MIMIPLHYLISFALLILIWREVFVIERAQRNRMYIAFLSLLAFQAALIGSRFGYEMEWLREIQPVTAVMIPPLAYLSFREKPELPKGLVHLLPLIALLLILAFSIEILDVFLALNNVFYAGALAWIGLKGSDGLAWAEINRVSGLLVTLWVIIALLFFSGVADAVIGLDFILTGGANTGSIVGNASISGLIGVVIIAILYARKKREDEKQQADRADILDEDVLEKVEKLLKEEKFYLDPDLNLNRIARRLTLPSRDVSKAINMATGMNVSQYVNALRIEEACRMLAQSGTNITETIYASGFNTKS
ncbi:MAG: AraC family transcriptional regulator, partial [Salaquimonas sp.]